MSDQITGEIVERDPKGRFVKGHRKTGGRAKRATELEYLDAIFEGVSLSDVTAGARKLAEKIRKGDLYAWKLLLPYLVGLPIQRLEHAGDNDAPVKILVEYIDETSTSA